LKRDGPTVKAVVKDAQKRAKVIIDKDNFIAAVLYRVLVQSFILLQTKCFVRKMMKAEIFEIVAQGAVERLEKV
jgi:hypothetical protein